MVAIILLNYKTFQDTIMCVESIKNCKTSECRIYIVDNNSPNESYQYLKEFFKDDDSILVIHNENNTGYADGNNFGVRRALKDGFDYGVIANTDILFCKDSLDQMIQPLKENPSIGIVAPKILNQEFKTLYEHKYCKIGLKELLLAFTILNCLNNRELYKYIIGAQKDSQAKIFCASGCCFAFSPSVLTDGELFDHHTFLGYEEIILANRLQQKMKSELFCPQARVIHNHNGPTKALGYRGYLVCNCSEMYYLKTYLKGSFFSVFALSSIRSIEYFIRCFKNKKLCKDFFKYIREYYSRVFSKQGLNLEDRKRIDLIEKRNERMLNE